MIFSLCEEPHRKLLDYRYAALDVETTGFSLKTDKIVEVGIVVWRDGEKTKEFSTLLNPRREISEASTAVHGITMNMVRKAPYFEEVADNVLDFLKDTIIIGHNVFSVDISFLNKELKESGRKPIYNRFIDTHILSRRLYPELRRRSLRALAQYLGIHETEFHRALQDARITMKIWRKMIMRLRNLGIETIGSFQEFGMRNGRIREKIRKIMTIARERGYVEIVYLSPFSGKTRRIIEPLGFRGNKVDAYCHLREDFRTFEIERILDIN